VLGKTVQIKLTPGPVVENPEMQLQSFGDSLATIEVEFPVHD
jgi:hypothetical protein